MNRNSLLGVLLCCVVLPVMAQDLSGDDDGPYLTVEGQGEVSATPDRAVVRLGVQAEAQEAAAAQGEVNAVMQRALQEIGAIGIGEDAIGTVGLSVAPVYSHPGRDSGGAPRVSGYRASNTIRVQVDELAKVAPVIDAGIGAGANRLEGVAFELANPSAAREEALRIAVRRARGKAVAIAEALDMRLGVVLAVVEGGSGPIQPVMARYAMDAMSAMRESTPVEPGQISVEATVNIRYRLLAAP